MIRIGINARPFTKPDQTGVSRYTKRLVEELAEHPNEDVEYVLFGPESLPDSLPRDADFSVAAESTPAHSGIRAHLWEQGSLPRALSRYELDAFHTPAGQPPIVAGLPQIVTIHDLSPVIHPDWFSRGYSTLYRALTPLAVRRADRIVTVSESSREDIVAAYPSAASKTVAIHNGVTPRDPDHGVPVDDLAGDRFLLFVGADNPRKNVSRLLNAYRRYRQQARTPVRLALAGPSNDLFASEDRPDVDGVVSLGYVSESELTWLYHNARALVFPSLYEGFGLPILEAMSTGTPVITSNRGAMAEVAGDAARLVDPTDPAAIARGIVRVLEDDEYAEALREAGYERAGKFTWERTARETLDVYREVANL